MIRSSRDQSPNLPWLLFASLPLLLASPHGISDMENSRHQSPLSSSQFEEASYHHILPRTYSEVFQKGTYRSLWFRRCWKEARDDEEGGKEEEEEERKCRTKFALKKLTEDRDRYPFLSVVDIQGCLQDELKNRPREIQEETWCWTCGQLRIPVNALRGPKWLNEGSMDSDFKVVSEFIRAVLWRPNSFSKQLLETTWRTWSLWLVRKSTSI